MRDFIKKNFLPLINLILIFILIFVCSTSNSHNTLSPDQLKDFANELKAKGLYQQAIEAYSEYLKNSNISKKLRSNINYMIADIYREYLKDFDKALFFYYKAKYIYPDTPLKQNINQKIVECLENSGRSREAQLALEESTLLGSNKKIKKGDVIVAKIDSDMITLREFEDWYKNLPEDIKKKFNTREKKKELLRQFIAQELMYRMALRKGLQNNPEVLKQTFEVKKNLMIQKLMEKELLGKIQISQSDVELYYKANKEKYNNKPLSTVYQKVYQDLLQQKIQSESQKLLDRMIKANSVAIFDGNVK